jgi:hypothetical protein
MFPNTNHLPLFGGSQLSLPKVSVIQPAKPTGLQPDRADLSGRLLLIRRVLRQLQADVSKGPVRLTGIRDAWPWFAYAGEAGLPELTFEMAGKEYKLSVTRRFNREGNREFKLRAADDSLFLDYFTKTDWPHDFVYYEAGLGRGKAQKVQILFPGEGYPKAHPFPAPQLQAETETTLTQILQAIRANVPKGRLGEAQKLLCAPNVIED